MEESRERRRDQGRVKIASVTVTRVTKRSPYLSIMTTSFGAVPLLSRAV